MKKILVLRGGALGDFIVTLPALSLLRQRWPAARIELAGNATAAQLGRARGVIDGVHSQHEARWSGLFGDAELALDFAAWLRDFDLVVNYWPDPDGTLRRKFPLRAGQIFLSAPALPTRAPAAAHYCEPLRELGLETTGYFCRLEAGRVILNPPPSAADFRRPIEPRTSNKRPSSIAIHPGSGSPRKNWPMENWRRLLDQLPGPVSLILGEAELDRWSTVIARAAHYTHPKNESADLQVLSREPTCLVNAPLEELVAHFSGCRLFLGHDSGISHLAAACGVKCVLLFGPTDPAMWAPPAPNARLLRQGPDLASISVEQVRQAALEALGDQT